MKYNSSQCELCGKIIGIRNGVIVTPLIDNKHHAWDVVIDCEHSKNGYCEIFRKQAELDKKEFGMCDRSCGENKLK